MVMFDEYEGELHQLKELATFNLALIIIQQAYTEKIT